MIACLSVIGVSGVLYLVKPFLSYCLFAIHGGAYRLGKLWSTGRILEGLSVIALLFNIATDLIGFIIAAVGLILASTGFTVASRNRSSDRRKFGSKDKNSV